MLKNINFCPFSNSPTFGEGYTGFGNSGEGVADDTSATTGIIKSTFCRNGTPLISLC